LALDRLSRYEASLWRQASQTILVLEALDRRKPQERNGLFRKVARQRAVRLLSWFSSVGCTVKIETDFEANYQVADSDSPLKVNMQ
jgi:hypothetical protein